MKILNDLSESERINIVKHYNEIYLIYENHMSSQFVSYELDVVKDLRLKNINNELYIDFPFKVSDDEKIFLSKDECENYIKELDDVKYYDVKDQIGYNLTENEIKSVS